MDQRDRLLSLIQLLYAAPGSLDGWQAFLNALCAATDGCGASFISHDLRSHAASIALTARTDPAAVLGYTEHWGTHDPWARSPKLSEFGPATVVRGEQLITHSEFRRTAYYSDFARGYDIVRCLAGMIEAGPDVVSVVSVNGTERRGPFGSDDTVLIEALMPHVHRALQLHRRLAATEAAAHSLSAVVDRSSHGVLFINRQGRVTYMNSLARRLSEACDGLAVEDRELRAARAVDTDRLRRLVAGAAGTTAGCALETGGVMTLGRPSGRRPLQVVISPLAQNRLLSPDDGQPAVLVMVSDPDHVGVPGEQTLRCLYSLTPGEAKLAQLLVLGLKLDQASAHLGLRTATVRTRLKAIFEKTDTHRQSELIQLLLKTAIPT